MRSPWRPSATRGTLELRARLKRRIRRFFDDAGLLEVDTPALSSAGTTDPAIASLSTRPAFAAGERRWLHTSPEFAMKRLLAAGSGDIWQMCTVFRDGEAGDRHNPEFTMVEWYRTGWDHHRLAAETASFVQHVLGDTVPLGDVVTTTYRDAFRAHAKLDPVGADHDALVAALDRHGVAPPAGNLGIDALLDLVMGTVVAPALGSGPARAVVVRDYPPGQAALARIAPGQVPVAERFELFIDGIEIANGFHELCDAGEQRRRFEADGVARAAAGAPAVPLDERLIAALEHGLPACAGVAVGFDRLVMLAAGETSIRRVLAFPHDLA